MITQSIQQAKQKGASDDLILSEILRQNPNLHSSIQKAQQMGSDPSMILEEIINQNQQTPKPELQQGITPLGTSMAGSIVSGIGKTG